MSGLAGSRPTGVGRRGTRTRAVRVILAASAALAVVAGCAQIPTSGPIRQGDAVVFEPGSAFPLPADPVPGADPVRIVEGFLSAGQAGLSDDFATARKFLTIGASVQWDPRARVLVYPAGAPEVSRNPDGSMLVAVPLEARVNEDGVYTEAAPDSREELVFELVQDAEQQWRISALEDGVVMSAANFDNQYRPVPLYFATADLQQLVPDQRWFPTTKGVTSAVSELLAGPVPWLRDAVRTGAPEGARLSTAAVTVTSDHVAEIDLSREANVGGPGAARGNRALLQAQLEATLSRLSRTLVTDVRVTVGGLPWEPDGTLTLERDTAPSTGPYVISGNRLGVVDGGVVQPLADAAPLDGLDANSPAIGLDGALRVVLDGSRRLMVLPTDGGEPEELMVGQGLIPPSIDRFGWIWTGDEQVPGEVLVVRDGVDPAALEADWLAERTVRGLRVARDGSRVAIISTATDVPGVSIDVAAVVRDADGVPQRLGEPVRIGVSLTEATDLAWVDELNVAVLGLSGDLSVPTMHVAQVGGPTTSKPIVVGAESIAAGKGERALYLVDAEGVLHSQQAGSWVTVAQDITAVTFPG